MWRWPILLSFFVCQLTQPTLGQPLSIDIQPNDLIVVQGWAASFNCSVQSLTASITWSIDGQLVTGRRFQIQTNGSLFINETQHQDSGFYQCLASSGNQTISSRRAQLSFAYLTPSFDRHPEQKTVAVGSSTSFYCINSGSVPLADILWEKDGRSFTDGSVISTGIDSTRTTSSLQIANAEKKTEGSYRCVATNRLLINERVESNAAYLTVNAPDVSPQFTILPSDLVAVSGQAAQLQCSASGNPSPSVTWENSSGSMVTNDSTVTAFINGSLHFTEITASAITVNSTFRCVATNRAGTRRSPYVSVRVARWTEKFVEEPSSVTAIAGGNITLRCSPPDSLPTASVQWLKDFAPVQSRQDKRVHAGGDLWIGNVRESDEGSYTCAAENTVLHLSALSQEAKLTVHVRPQIFLRPPASLAVVVGSVLRLNCSASGDPIPIIEWYFKNKLLRDDNNVTIDSQHLTIQTLSLDGEGMYECVASNAAGTVSAQVSIDVQIPPVITTVSSNSVLSEGSTTTLLCLASGDPIPMIRWTGPKLDSYQGSQLTLNNTNRTQDGTYTCIATNVAGSASSSAIVDVQYAPQIIFVTPNTTSIVEDEVKYKCLADGDPKPTVLWYRSNSVVGNSSNGTATIYFRSAQSSDDGAYVCTAVNVIGQVSAMRYLTILEHPLINVPPSDVIAKVRGTISLQCQAVGIPTPRHTWQKDGSTLQAQQDSTRRLAIASDGTLSIAGVSISDSGTYTCIVNNVVGSVNVSALVVIQGLPDPPREVHALAVSSSEIILRWTPPTFTGNTALLTFVLRYRIVGQSTWNLAFQLVSLSLLSFDQLTPYTDYEFAVSAENSIGSSQMSNITRATTHQAAPAVPLITAATGISSNAIKTTWLPPQPPNGVLQFYELRFDTIDEGLATNSTTLRIDSATTNATIYGLVPFSTYVFSLRASTGNETQLLWSNWSTPVTAKTLEGVPLEAPGNVSVTVVSQRSISLQWTAPNAVTIQGKLQGYRVYYKVLEANSNVSIATSPPGQNRSVSFVLSGLRPNTRYAIAVAAYNSANNGPSSSQIAGKTTEDVPEVAPTLVSLLAAGPDSILVSWFPPPLETHNGILRGYQILYRELSESVFSKDIIYENKTTFSSQRNHTISDLKVYLFYEVNLNAFTARGTSRPSHSMVVRTGEGIPSPPTSLQAIAITRTSISLTWQLPDMVNGILRHYTVYYDSADMDGSSDSFQELSNETLITLTHLSPNTEYNITVTATTGYQEGPHSEILSLKTMPLPTSPPLPTTSRPSAKTATTSVAAAAVTGSIPNTPSNSIASPTEKSEDDTITRVIIIVCSSLGVFLLVLVVVLCGIHCQAAGKDDKREPLWACCYPKQKERKRKNYKLSHFDDEASEAGDSSWPLSTGDNFSFKKPDDIVTFQDSFLPGRVDGKGSHETLELGYDLSPIATSIAQYEADAGFSTFKPRERPPSLPGPSPYSSQENLATADQMAYGDDDISGATDGFVMDSAL